MTSDGESGSGTARIPAICAAFLRLGLTSFGGPVAHLGYFRKEFVVRRKWLDDASYADLVALCQFLPGPASSQVVFILGMRRAGLAGALAACACFMLPSVCAMTALAYGLSSLGGLAHAGLLHGLRLAAVAVVAQAVWGMARSLCPDAARRVMALAAAAAVIQWPGVLTQIGAIGACGVASWRLAPAAGTAMAATQERAGGHRWAVASLAVFAGLLAVLPLLAARGGPALALFDAFYRSGSLVFGGGHVVLALLRSEVVPRGWMDDATFLAGYGAAQALPGPLFTFAAYLGTLIIGGAHAWAGGLLAVLALFLPGWLIVGGAYPFWHALRAKAWARSALGGANAAVVGILLAALYRPLASEALRGWMDAGAVLAALLLLAWARLPAWALVAVMAAAGQWLLP